MTQFSTVNPDGRESNIRILKQSDILRCPHVILAAEHYRADGTCKCDDPKEAIMIVWGYRWDETQRLWVYDKAV